MPLLRFARELLRVIPRHVGFWAAAINLNLNTRNTAYRRREIMNKIMTAPPQQSFPGRHTVSSVGAAFEGNLQLDSRSSPARSHRIKFHTLPRSLPSTVSVTANDRKREYVALGAVVLPASVEDTIRDEIDRRDE